MGMYDSHEFMPSDEYLCAIDGDDTVSFSVTVERETEKAYFAFIPELNARKWLPKSQVEINGNVASAPNWLIVKLRGYL